MARAKKTIAIKDQSKPPVRVANRFDNGPYKGAIRQDEPDSIKAIITDGVRDYTIIFPRRLLEKKLIKYGSQIRVLAN